MWQTELQITAYLAHDIISYNCSLSEYHNNRQNHQPSAQHNGVTRMRTAGGMYVGTHYSTYSYKSLIFILVCQFILWGSMWDLNAHLKFKRSASLSSCGLQHKPKSSAVMYRAMSRFYLGLRAAVRCIEAECLQWTMCDW